VKEELPRKTKAQRQEELQQIFDEADYILNSISADTSVPRNIRKITTQAIEELKLENTPAVNASNGISLLDDLSQDPNCPLHTRTQIYQILSLLEQIRDF
jgi:hypothetical protein